MLLLSKSLFSKNTTVLFSVFLFLSFTSFSQTAIPTDAVLFNGNYYKVIEREFSWQEATKKCENLGALLTSIKSKEVDAFIFKLSTGKCLWIGASD